MKITRVLRLLVAGVVLVAGQASATITYFHNDLLGSPVAATDENRAIVWKESYRPYGERIVNDPASTSNSIYFTGRRQDPGSGLVYMGARYYDPVIGRFLSTDSISFDEHDIHTFNRYGYSLNNPAKYVDRQGRQALPGISPPPFAGMQVATRPEGRTSHQQQIRQLEGYSPPTIGSLQVPTTEMPEGLEFLLGGFLGLGARLVDSLIFSSSSYVDITKGDSVPNRTTNVTRGDFEKNLLAEGWTKTTSKDGKVSIFDKNGASYRVRDFSKEGSKTADYYKPGSEKADVKIRLGD